MRISKTRPLAVYILLFASLACFTSCLTSRKMDKYVSKQYNDELPKPIRKKNAEITITSTNPSRPNIISTTKKKTSHVLPLIIYWQFDYRHTCTLNSAIPVTNFSNTLNNYVSKGLTQKLNGQKMELTIEEIPTAFALVDKAHLFLVFGWDHLYMEPDNKDLIVSYKLYQNDNSVKTGKITIKNNLHDKDIHYFQSWKSATRGYLTRYDSAISSMAKEFANQLMEEIGTVQP
jgi:hypothetical protein